MSAEGGVGYLQGRYGRWYFFAKNEFDENFIERQVDNAGVQHCFCYKLANHPEDVCPFSSHIMREKGDMGRKKNSLSAIVDDVILTDGCRVKPSWMVNIKARVSKVRIAPYL